MDRINGANTVDIGGGRRGWRMRNLLAGVSGTEFTAPFQNSVQEELVGIIEEAGFMPDEEDWTQLRQALGVLFGGGGTLTGNGWQRLPGGLILQWGAVARASRTLSTNVTVTFPLAFPAACFAVIPTIDTGDAGLMDMAAGIDTPSLTQVALLAGALLTEGAESRTFGWRWMAIGI